MFFVRTNSVPYVDYRPATYCDGKEPFISYYVKNPADGRLKRIRQKVGHIAERSRKSAVRTIIADINSRLALGWNPLISNTAHKAFSGLYEAFNAFLKVKAKECEGNSMRSYTSMIKSFRAWLDASGFSEKSYSNSVTELVAREYMNFVENDDRISPRTFNNKLKFMVVLFNWLKEKGYCSDNPFSGIPKKPKRLTKKIRRMFTDDELSRLWTFLATDNPQYLVAAMLCYVCFLRPKELSMLKCRDIDLSRQLVHIRPEIAKNDNDSYRTIPDELCKIMSSMDLSKPDNYIFGFHANWDFSPGHRQVCSRKLAKYWELEVRPNCNFPLELQFYSLKDTGITNMLGDGVPITAVQQQADHSSPAVTSIYVGRKPTATDLIKHIDIKA